MPRSQASPRSSPQGTPPRERADGVRGAPPLKRINRSSPTAATSQGRRRTPDLLALPTSSPEHGTRGVGLVGVMREVLMEQVNPLRLRVLLEIERTGSISGAAAACGIGQPSASTHLRMLEAAVGHRLVTRTGRGSTLTVAGKAVAAHGSRVLSTLDDMRREIDALGARGRGELSLAASLMPSMVLVPKVLNQYSDKYPGVSVKLRTLPSEVVVQEIARSGVDLGIAGDVRMPAEVASEQILVDELVGIAAAGLLSSNGDGVNPGELARHSLLIGAEGSSTRAVTERYIARSEYRPISVWEFNSYEAIVRAVANGLGVSFLSRLLVREEVERGELVTFHVCGMEPMERSIFSVHSAVSGLSPQAAAFVALLTGTGSRRTGRSRSKVTIPSY